jgi:hypothetical protein
MAALQLAQHHISILALRESQELVIPAIEPDIIMVLPQTLFDQDAVWDSISEEGEQLIDQPKQVMDMQRPI